jgi:hypothetical protein
MNLHDSIAIAEREAFRKRLEYALTRAGIDKDNISTVAKTFNLVDSRFRYPAVRTWLKEGVIPQYEKLKLIAERLDVNAAWLRFGEGEVSTSTKSKKLALLSARLGMLTDDQISSIEHLVRKFSNKHVYSP